MFTVSPACVKCGICAEVCPIGIIGLDESGPKLLSPAACVRCGHCVASCPHAALDHSLAPLAAQVPLGDFPVLDADTVNAIERFLRDDPVDGTRALVDDIIAVGIGGHYLGRRSTRELYRAGELWEPRLWQRQPFEHYVGTSLVREAAARAEELIATNDVPPLPEDVTRHVDKLIADYLASKG
jgi:ferredoxin